MATPLVADHKPRPSEAFEVEVAPTGLSSESRDAVGAGPQVTLTRSLRRNGCGRHVQIGIASLVILVVGIVLDHPGEAWITRFYLSMQIISTIGYGDIVPDTDRARLFFTAFVLCVMAFFSYWVNIFRIEAARAAEERRQRRLLRAEGAGMVPREPISDLAKAVLIFVVPILVCTVFFRYMEHCSCSFGVTWVGNDACPEEPAEVDFQTCADNGGEVKTWATAFYFAIISATTIGFGDFTAVTSAGRWFMMLWIPIAVFATANFISKLSDAMFSTESTEELEVDTALALDKKAFDEIDVDKNGYLSRGEFYEYLMVKYGFAKQETMDVMRAKFDSIDVKGNEMVTWEELSAAKAQRLREVEASKAK